MGGEAVSNEVDVDLAVLVALRQLASTGQNQGMRKVPAQ